jgi:hypothetical protein
MIKNGVFILSLDRSFSTSTYEHVADTLNKLMV